MFNVKKILKAFVTAESCNAVNYLRGMLVYDFMIGCTGLMFPCCWKGEFSHPFPTSAPPLPSVVLALTFRCTCKPILITNSEMYHPLYMLGEFSAI